MGKQNCGKDLKLYIICNIIYLTKKINSIGRNYGEAYEEPRENFILS